MVGRNKYGLTRNIRQSLKKLVRRKCGYGCVICGQIPVHYDHCRTPFAEAREHDPDDIYLLCHHHHGMKTNGQIGPSEVEAAAKHREGVRSQVRFKQPATRREFVTRWGSVEFRRRGHLVVLAYEKVLSLKLSRNPLEPVLISGRFRDEDGRLTCEIVDNEFDFEGECCGDFRNTKNRFEYWLPDGSRTLAFSLTAAALTIEEFFQVLNGTFALVEGDSVRIGNRGIQQIFENVVYKNSAIAMEARTSEMDGMGLSSILGRPERITREYARGLPGMHFSGFTVGGGGQGMLVC